MPALRFGRHQDGQPCQATTVKVTVACTAHCIGRCDWTAAGDWPDVDRAAERHTRSAGHPTGTEARPA